MNRIFPMLVQSLLKVALCAGLAMALSACASNGGEKGVKAPFPKLADVPPRPHPSTTAKERAALRAQLERRRDEVNAAARSLLRGGTEPVPISLDSEVPEAPAARRAPLAPPPLPEGLPRPPAGPEFLSDAGASAKPEPASKEKKGETGSGDDEMIEAPKKDQMPPARAAAKPDGAAQTDDAPDNGDEEGKDRPSGLH